MLIAVLAAAGCGPGTPGEVIGQTSIRAQGLVQDESFLYWRTEDSLVRLSKDGGAVEVIASGQSPIAHAVAGDEIFWIDRVPGEAPVQSVRAAPKVGGAVRVLDADEPTAPEVLRGMATDGAFLYWSASDGRFRRIPVDGSAEAAQFGPSLAELEVEWGIRLWTPTSSVAAAGGVMFFTAYFGIFRFDETNGALPIVGAREFVAEHAMVTDPPDGFVYWVERGTGGANGGQLKVLDHPVPDPADPRLLALPPITLLSRSEILPGRPFSDGVHVYYLAGSEDPRIKRAPAQGGLQDEDYASGDVGEPVVDGTSVYWIDDRGRVHKGPK